VGLLALAALWVHSAGGVMEAAYQLGAASYWMAEKTGITHTADTLKTWRSGVEEATTPAADAAHESIQRGFDALKLGARKVMDSVTGETSGASPSAQSTR